MIELFFYFKEQDKNTRKIIIARISSLEKINSLKNKLLIMNNIISKKNAYLFLVDAIPNL